MKDRITHYRLLDENFEVLFRSLAETWPRENVEYVREEVGHGEYGDALENLIAIAVQSKRGLTQGQTDLVEAVAAAMTLDVTSLMPTEEKAAHPPSPPAPRQHS